MFASAASVAAAAATEAAAASDASYPLPSSGYPPGVVLFLSKLLDLSTFGRCDWRRLVPFGWSDAPDGWFSETHRVGNVVATLRPLLSYARYVDLVSSDAQGEEWEWETRRGWDRWQWYQTFLSPSTAYDFAFRTSSTVLGDLTSYESIMALLLLVWLIRRAKGRLLPYFSSLGRRAGRATHGSEWERANKERIVKFGEYVFRLLYHSAISAYGIWYFRNQPWWDLTNEHAGTKLLYVDHDSTVSAGRGDTGHPIEPGMAWYYLIQCAYNLEALVALAQLSFVAPTFRWPVCVIPTGGGGGRDVDGDSDGDGDGGGKGKKVHRTVRFQSPIIVRWSTTVRGDFREMCVHHLVTNLLIMGSSYFRFTRIGSMVFLVHDVSDVPVDLSKLANFLKWKKATIACFVTMVLVWLVTRLVILPFVIYRSVLTESHLLVTANGLDPIYYYCYRPVFYVLIALIILLHLVWFLMFVRMGWLLVSRGEAHDLSEHKKGEDQLPGQAVEGNERRRKKEN